MQASPKVSHELDLYTYYVVQGVQPTHRGLPTVSAFTFLESSGHSQLVAVDAAIWQLCSCESKELCHVCTHILDTSHLFLSR